MATDQGEKTFLSHTAQQVDDAIDAVATIEASLSDYITSEQYAEDMEEIEVDITYIKDALVEMVDSGAKNLTFLDTAAGEYVDILFTTDIPAGTYVLSFATLDSDDTDADTCMVVALKNGSEVSQQKQCNRANDGTYVMLTLTSSADKFRIYASDTAAHSTGDTLDYTDCMVCKEAYWHISDKFVQYVPSQYELWQMILHP